MGRAIIYVSAFIILLTTMVSGGDAPFVKVTDPDGTVRYVSATPEPGSATPVPVAPRKKRERPSGFTYQDPNTQHKSQFAVIPYDSNLSCPVVEARINDKVDVKMLVDTGASISFLSEDIFNKLNVRKDDFKGPFYIMTGGGLIETWSIEVDSVSVGDLRQEKLDMMISYYPSANLDGILGQDFLTYYRYEINPETKEISFYQLGKGQTLYGGRSGEWWQNKFSVVRDFLNYWIYVKREYSERKWQNAADVMITHYRHQMNVLETDASRAGVPRKFRADEPDR